MKRLLTFLLLFCGLMALLVHIRLQGGSPDMAESMMALGFTLIAAYLIGLITARFNLPKITGYIVAGVVMGPFALNLISQRSVENLQLIDSIALGLIALTAGGEFRYKSIRHQFNTISSVILFQIIIVFAGFMAFFFFYRSSIPLLAGQAAPLAVGVGIIFGSLAIAKSPATTIAIITETGAKGKFTDFVLGVTVFKDIIVVLVFSLALSFAKPLIIPEATLHLSYVLEVLLEILLSIVVGVAAGGLILLYLKYVNSQTVLFLLGFILFGIEVSHMLHVESVLVFMVAGFFVQNFSNAGSRLIEAIERGSLPVYVTFFAIAGASLNLPVFLDNWLLAIIIVLLRMATTFAGTFAGGKLTRSTREVQQLGWMGFIGQAGLTLGLVGLVNQAIPGTIGLSIKTLVVASVTLNQIIGPILFRYSLIKAGEAS